MQLHILNDNSLLVHDDFQDGPNTPGQRANSWSPKTPNYALA